MMALPDPPNDLVGSGSAVRTSWTPSPSPRDQRKSWYSCISMKPVGTPERSEGLSTHRIEALSDGVFSIAMTLLILDIRVPVVSLISGQPSLAHRLFELWPRLLSYATSFMILGIYWIGQHNQFYVIKRSDRTFLWINILFLMCIAFVPFPTSLLGSYSHQQIAVVVYGLVLIAIGLVLYLHWWYATHHQRLVDPDINRQLVTQAKKRILLGPASCVLSIGLSFFSLLLSLILFALILIVYLFPGRIDQHLRI